MDTARLAELVREALGPVFGSEQINVRASDRGDELLIVGQAWTMCIEGLPDHPVAVVSINQQLAAPYTLHESREEAMPDGIDEAFAYVDEQVEGALSVALQASGNPLSLDLLAALAQHQARFAQHGVTIERVA